MVSRISLEENKRMLMILKFHYSNGVPKKNAHYGQGSGEILLDDLACDGDESNLEECSHPGMGNQNCYHSQDAGVKCCKYANSASSYSKPNLKCLHFSQNTFQLNFICHT